MLGVTKPTAVTLGLQREMTSSAGTEDEFQEQVQGNARDHIAHALFSQADV